MDDQTNEVDQAESLTGTSEEIPGVPEEETPIPPTAGIEPGASAEIQIETVAQSDVNGPTQETGGVQDGSQSSIARYGVWAALLGGTVLVAIVLLRFLAQRRKQAEVPIEVTSGGRWRFRRSPQDDVEITPATSSWMQRIRIPWNRGEVEVVETTTRRLFVVRSPWRRDEGIQQEPIPTRRQRLAARLPRSR